MLLEYNVDVQSNGITPRICIGCESVCVFRCHACSGCSGCQNTCTAKAK